MMDFDTFLDAARAILISGTFPTLNLPTKNRPSLVSNYHSYKRKTIKLLPYYSFYGGHIPPRKIESLFLAVPLRKISHKDPHLAAFP